MRIGDGDRARYRIATLPPDTLWRVVEDVHAEGSARVGAAVALRRTLDDEGRVRITRVAETCASREVRDALHAAATSSDDDLPKHLAALT